VYRGVALALGLLVTPAIALDYTTEECAGIERVLNACPLVLAPKVFTRCGLAIGYIGGRDFLQLKDNYPNDWGWINCREHDLKLDCDEGPAMQQIQDLCQEVCDRKITPMDALQKFCPRPKS
jgi:hypothetical protein